MVQRSQPITAAFAGKQHLAGASAWPIHVVGDGEKRRGLWLVVIQRNLGENQTPITFFNSQHT
jgi:hypothetical protein